MPSLIYVLGLSGAVHIVNYYREEAQRYGAAGAPERALRHGWWPCTIAAFTTALGLISLCTSNILPIRKFGLFSALGVMATLILLFTFLPAALQVWAPGYDKRREQGGPASGGGSMHQMVMAFWDRVGHWVVARHWLVTAATLIVMAVFGAGLFRINTSVQLLKLFDTDAKIIQDYEWLEAHLGALVPMELVVKIEPEVMLPERSELKHTPEERSRHRCLLGLGAGRYLGNRGHSFFRGSPRLRRTMGERPP
jgi:predicted RND superfamily exporter protein